MADGGAIVLVVDDDPFDRHVLALLLEKKGYRVEEADGAEAALAAVAASRPDLILLDVNMPGMDGFAVCRRLKAMAAGGDVPVMFISGAEDVAAKVQAFASGGVDYVTKPFHNEEVLARVATHLALHGLQRELEERVRQRSSVLAEANARLEQEIAERCRAEERFRAMLEAAPDALVIVDESRRIVLVNGQAEALFGYGRDQLLGQPVEMLMPEPFREHHAAAGAAYIESPRPRSMGEDMALVGRRRDGSEFPVEISLSPLRTGDRQLIISAIRDATLRRETEDSLRGLATHRDRVREEERKRIAGEIHDELGSLLTALKMDVGLLRMQLGDHPKALERLGQMRELVEATIGMVRQVATRLRPAALNLGLVPALEWLVEDFQRRHGVACSLHADAEVAMDDAQATAVFRIVQESLTNVARHAAASQVAIGLTRDSEGMTLAIRDDGRGFDPAGVRRGSLGLFGIRERAEILGGRAEVESSPGRGTLVSIWIPLPKEEAK